MAYTRKEAMAKPGLQRIKDKKKKPKPMTRPKPVAGVIKPTPVRNRAPVRKRGR